MAEAVLKYTDGTTLRKLTPEGEFECGHRDWLSNKIWCYVAIADSGAHLGVCVANEPGYYPVPRHWCWAAGASAYKKMCEHAEELNRANKLDTDACIRIVASTMNRRSKPK